MEKIFSRKFKIILIGKIILSGIQSFFNPDKKRTEFEFPKSISGYDFKKNLGENKASFTESKIGLYKNREGKKAIAKIWQGKKITRNYYWFINEIRAYSGVNYFYEKYGKEIKKNFPDVIIPKMIYFEIEKNRLILLTEFLEGESIEALSAESRVKKIERVVEYFSFLGKFATDKKLKKYFLKRGRLFWFLSFHIYALVAAIKFPFSFLKIAKAYIFFMVNIFSRLDLGSMQLVHRDLNRRNIIFDKDNKKIGIVDFGLAAYSSHIFDIAAIHKAASCFDNIAGDLRESIFMRVIFSDEKKLRIYNLLSIYIAINFMAICFGSYKRIAKEQLLRTLSFNDKGRKMSKKVFWLVIILGVSAVYALGIRGLPGNPSIEELKSPEWRFDGPLELSPERGRFALVYSIAENNSLYFSAEVAKLAVPDLAFSNEKKFVSLFAPGISFIVLPGYLIGKILGIAQVGAYSCIALFALFNFLLIIFIAKELGANRWWSFLGALTFSVATPAFVYGVNLYQHHVSVFLLLTSIYAIIRYNNYFSLAWLWFACSLAVVVDNPNFFMMFPVGLFAVIKTKEMLVRAYEEEGLKKLRRAAINVVISLLAILPPILFFLWYNNAAYGDPLQLPGTLPSVSDIDENNMPVNKNKETIELIKESEPSGESKEKTAVGFFKTRNLYNGFYEHFVSADRGILYFTPIIFLGILGIAILYRSKPKICSLLVAIIGVNVLLYSMWGDPWGGWAFGSRYLIPTYALLSIGIAVFLSRRYKKVLVVTIFIILFAYSAGVNILGAVTTSTIPTKPEVLSLEEKTGHEEKYTFLRSWEFLNKKYSQVGSKSFIYQAKLKNHMDAKTYFYLIYALVMCLALWGIRNFYREQHNKN